MYNMCTSEYSDADCAYATAKGYTACEDDVLSTFRTDKNGPEIPECEVVE